MSEYAKNDQDLLKRLEAITPELFEYAYGKDEIGERFQGWDEIGNAYGALQRVIDSLREHEHTNRWNSTD